MCVRLCRFSIFLKKISRTNQDADGHGGGVAILLTYPVANSFSLTSVKTAYNLLGASLNLNKANNGNGGGLIIATSGLSTVTLNNSTMSNNTATGLNEKECAS